MQNWRFCELILRGVSIITSTGRSCATEATPAIKDNLIPVTHPLQDNFNRVHNYLRISLTERCNLRCTYCMPQEGVKLTEKSNLLTTDEVIHLARIFVQEGVTKIRLTGGEPTVRKDLVDIIKQLKQIDGLEQVGITTNALVLTRQLVPAGCDQHQFGHLEAGKI